MNPLSRSVIDALNTATLHTYMREVNPPGQLIIHAFHTITLYIYISIYGPFLNQA